MKQFSPGAAAALVLSAVTAAGSVSFLGPCVHEDGSFGACHWAGQAMLGIGLLLAVLSLTALLVKDGRVRAGSSLPLPRLRCWGSLSPEP